MRAMLTQPAELAHLIMKVHKMKKENIFLRKSLQTNQSPLQLPWSGFRDNAHAHSEGSDESETSSSPTDEGSKVSGYSQDSPVHPTEPPFDGVIHKLERCQIVSRSVLPRGHHNQGPNQSPFVQMEFSTISSAGSTSSRESMTDNHLANLQGNRMDLIFAADRQRMSAQQDSEAPIRTEEDYSL